MEIFRLVLRYQVVHYCDFDAHLRGGVHAKHHGRLYELDLLLGLVRGAAYVGR